MTSTSMGCSLAIRERTVFSMHLASLYAGTSTDTGSVTGGPQRKPRRRTRRACQPERSSISTNRPMTRLPMIARPTTRPSVMCSEAWTRKIHAWPFQRSRPVDAGVRAGRVEGLGEVLEGVAPRLEVGQEPVQGLHGLVAVTAGVVHQDDGAVAALRGGAANDLVDAGLAPVLAVGVVDDGDVSAAADVLGHRPGRVVHGRGEGGVRRAEQGGAIQAAPDIASWFWDSSQSMRRFDW
ncbi:hypothetical protein SGLAM104S_08893 [Streptomyces glaucescens]